MWPGIFNWNEAKPLDKTERHTNNRAEYTAVLRTLEFANHIDPNVYRDLRVFTDSRLIIESVNIYLGLWKRKGWRTSRGEPVLNQDLLNSIDRLLSYRNVEFVPVHSESSDYQSSWNNCADFHARQAARFA